MKKTFLAAIFLSASMLAFNASAQTPEEIVPCGGCPETVCGPENGCIVPPGGKLKNFDPFIGTTITADQKAKIEQLNKTRAEKRAAEAKKDLESKQALDSIRRVENVNYLHQVRDIIGPDQYVIFLENIAVGQPQGKGIAPGKDGVKKPNAVKDGKIRSDKKKGDDRRSDRRPDKM